MDISTIKNSYEAEFNDIFPTKEEINKRYKSLRNVRDYYEEEHKEE